MRVSLLAKTELHRPAAHAGGYRLHPHSYGITDADQLSEFAGRLCYLSWDRPNPATRSNDAYLSNIIGQQHFSVLEHASATFLIEDVSRSLTHELVRHRHLSYSQVSQRYVDVAHMDYVVPPALVDDIEATRELAELFGDATQLYRDLEERLTEKGLTRKQAREAARAVLPNMTSTSLVVTGNLRAWREVVAKRSSPAADAEIRELATELLRHLKAIAPNAFQDQY